MTKPEAEQAMLEGKRITHEYFSPDEWCEIRNGDIRTEDGCNMGQFRDEFWSMRQEGFLDGWSIVKR